MTLQLDKVFEHELEVIQTLKGTLDKKDKIRFSKWISRLQYICRTKHERVIRNRYLELLSLQVQLLGHLEEPFTHIPPEGNLGPIPIYWLERFQRARTSINRSRSPQYPNHEWNSANSPGSAQAGPKKNGYFYKQGYEDNANPPLPPPFNEPAFVNTNVQDGNLSGSAFQMNQRMYYNGYQNMCQQQDQPPNPVPFSTSKTASSINQSMTEDSMAPIGMSGRKSTPTIDTYKNVRQTHNDTLDSSVTRESFSGSQHIQLNGAPIDDELAAKINQLLKHELPLDAQPPRAKVHQKSEQQDDSTACPVLITELQAMPESIPSTITNMHKLVASAAEYDTAHKQIVAGRNASGQKDDSNISSVEAMRSRKLLSTSRTDSGAGQQQEQRYIVAATIETPISAHVSRSGTGRSARSARESESLVDTPIMAASHRDHDHDVVDKSTHGTFDSEPSCQIATMNVSQSALAISEAHPILSPGRNNVSYVSASTRVETLSVVHAQDAQETVMYRTQKDNMYNELNSVEYNQGAADSFPFADTLMTTTTTTTTTATATMNPSVSTGVEQSGNVGVSLVSPGIKTLVIKPHTTAPVPELTAVQMGDASPKRSNIPDTITVTPEQQDEQTWRSSPGNMPHSIIYLQSKSVITNEEKQTTQKDICDLYTTATAAADPVTIYLEGTHQDDHLIKPVKTDFVPHVIPTKSPRHSNHVDVPSVSSGNIQPVNSPTLSPRHGDKKPRVRLLPSDQQEQTQPQEPAHSQPQPQPQQSAQSSALESPSRRLAGQSLYSTNLLSKRASASNQATSFGEPTTSLVSRSEFEPAESNPDLITNLSAQQQEREGPDMESLLLKSKGCASFVAPDLADVEDDIGAGADKDTNAKPYTDQSLYFVISDKRGQDILSPDSLTCEAAGLRLVNTKLLDEDETAVAAIMSECTHPEPEQKSTISHNKSNLSTDFDDMDPPVIVCDTGAAPPIVIRSKTVAPPLSLEENIALLRSAKQDGCISYSRSRAGSRAVSLSRRSMSTSRYSEMTSMRL